MFKEYMQAFTELLAKHFKGGRVVTPQEIDFLCTYFQNNPVKPFETETSVRGLERYVMKTILYTLTYTTSPYTNYSEIELWTTEQVQYIYNLPKGDLVELNTLFDLKPLQAFSSDFGKYIEQLAKDVFDGLKTACRTHIMVIYLTMLHAEKQTYPNYDDDIDVYLFQLHFKENRLDLDYLLGKNDVTSKRLANYMDKRKRGLC